MGFEVNFIFPPLQPYEMLNYRDLCSFSNYLFWKGDRQSCYNKFPWFTYTLGKKVRKIYSKLEKTTLNLTTNKSKKTIVVKRISFHYQSFH